jgi:hypothetical protein
MSAVRPVEDCGLFIFDKNNCAGAMIRRDLLQAGR